MPVRTDPIMSRALFAGVEAGGTKMLCALSRGDGEMLAQARVPTSTPERTFAAIEAFFSNEMREHGQPDAVGVASFGPLNFDRTSADYGSLTTTPKPGWSGTNILERMRQMIDAPTVIDTDVNCAGLAEARFGAGRSLHRLCYVTVGTGIGVGYVENGRPLNSLAHPEAGHMRVPRALRDRTFAGSCPFHEDCLEGLASGPAMAERWSLPAEALGDDHIGWVFEEHYLAALCINLTYMLRPERIILGGGVMAHPQLLDRVRARFAALAGGYSLDRCSANAETFICAPMAQVPSPGLLGAIELARDFLAVANGS